MEQEIVVVGSGFSGSILARKIAEELHRKVTVIEKRSHIGGNMYDETDTHGILIQKYGPHFLNTNHFSIIRYYNMDVCMEHALQYFEEVRAYLEKRV